LSPDLELLDRRGPKGIRRDDQHLLPLFFVAMGELGDRGGLADAVYTRDQDDPRRRRRWQRGLIAQQRADFFLDGGDRGLGCFQVGSLSQRRQQLLRRRDADVGDDERLLEVRESGLQTRVAPEKRLHSLAKALTRLRQTGSESAPSRRRLAAPLFG